MWLWSWIKLQNMCNGNKIMAENYNLIIFGASSELSEEILKKNKLFKKIILISTKKIKKKRENIHSYQIKNYKTLEIKKVLNKHLNYKKRIIIFMGLNDNKLFGTLKDKEVEMYLKINLIYHIKILNLLLINFRKF